MADSVTCTAPPPTTAPPHAQAQSFARAIRTDIATLFQIFRPIVRSRARSTGLLLISQSAEQSVKFNNVNHDLISPKAHGDYNGRNKLVNVSYWHEIVG
ncbi:hypothetical protein [Sphingomonas aquatica]|uniref:hypothetical protein n=1 Tax=Sphingomonas aquatica TaxID=1763824 RepID=UPI001454D6FF